MPPRRQSAPQLQTCGIKVELAEEDHSMMSPVAKEEADGDDELDFCCKGLDSPVNPACADRHLIGCKRDMPADQITPSSNTLGGRRGRQVAMLRIR